MIRMPALFSNSDQKFAGFSVSLVRMDIVASRVIHLPAACCCMPFILT